MSDFSNITNPELIAVKDKLAIEVETLRRKLLADLDVLETKSHELNNILIELEQRNAGNQSNNSQPSG